MIPQGQGGGTNDKEAELIAEALGSGRQVKPGSEGQKAPYSSHQTPSGHEA